MKKRLILAALSLALLTAILIGKGSYLASVRNTASDAWRGDAKIEFKTISVYFEEHTPISQEEARSAQGTLERRVKEISEEIRPLVVWGKTGELFLRAGNHELFCQSIIASDSFFLMHRFPLLSGSVYAFGADGVVLNKQAAWVLFGSADAAGKNVMRDGCETPVLAVVDDLLETPCAFVPYGETDAEATFFETVMPEFVKGFALEGIHNCFYESESTRIVENDARYERRALREACKELFSPVQPARFRVPTWEYAEERAGRILMVWWAAADAAWIFFAVESVWLLVTFIRLDPFSIGETLHRMKKKKYRGK